MKPQAAVMFGCLMLVGAGLYFAPDSAAARLRGAVLDTIRPGQQGIRVAAESMLERWTLPNGLASKTPASEVERLSKALADEKQKNRILQIRLAELNDQLLLQQQGSSAIKRFPPLLKPSLIETAVLGDAIAEQWRGGKLIDFGAKNGIREHELVLSSKSSNRALIDIGEDSRIVPEDALLLGRAVIGKVEHVGRWTSTFLLVTDPRYRGRAQLIRETDAGFVFESQGLLKGQGGPLCRLDGIPAEKSVHIHDAVYTADRDGSRPVPLYYGEVVEASLGIDDREWTVLVKPIEVPTPLTKVSILRMTVNPDRLETE